MLQYNPSISGSLNVTGSINVTNGISGTINGVDVQIFSASVSQTITNVQTATGSQDRRLISIESFTSSTSARLGSIETISASNIGRLNALETTSASVDSLNTTQTNRLNSLELKTGSLASTGSNLFVGTQTITGSVYISADLIVQGSSCIQNITGSSVSIGTNTISLNTATPSVRHAGIIVQDSGSSAGITGSILWDSLCNKWIYSNPSTIGYSGGMLLSGPRTTTLGSESPLTCNYIAKSGGGDHLYDSAIYESGSCVGIGTNSPTSILHISSTTPTLKLTDSAATGNNGDVYLRAEKTGVGYNNLTTVAFTYNLKGGGSETSFLNINNTGVACFSSNICSAGIQSSDSIIIRKDASIDNRYIQLCNTQSGGYRWDLVTRSTAQGCGFGILNNTTSQYALLIDANNVGVFGCQICSNGIVSTGIATFTAQGAASYGTINLESDDPFIRLYDNGVGSTTDKKKWDIRAIGATGYESFDIRTINDANTVFSTKMSILHSGVACFSCQVCALQFRGYNYGVSPQGTFRGGIYTCNQVSGTGTDCSLTLFSEGGAGGGNFYIATGGSADVKFAMDANGIASFRCRVSSAGLTTSDNLNFNTGDGNNWYIRGQANGPAIRMKYHGGSTNRSAGLGWVDNNSTYYETLCWQDTSMYAFGTLCSNNVICAYSLATNAGGLNENFAGTGGGHVSRYFAAKYMPENATTAFFRITTSGASATQIHLAGTNAGVGWYSSQIYHAANTAYWGGWIGSGASVSIASGAAGYISGVYSDGAGGQNYCVTVANNGTSTSSLVWAYITTITYGSYSTTFTQL